MLSFCEQALLANHYSSASEASFYLNTHLKADWNYSGDLKEQMCSLPMNICSSSLCQHRSERDPLEMAGVPFLAAGPQEKSFHHLVLASRISVPPKNCDKKIVIIDFRRNAEIRLEYTLQSLLASWLFTCLEALDRSRSHRELFRILDHILLEFLRNKPIFS